MPYISHFVETTKVLGPGNRFVVWFQGCLKSCTGCINVEGQKVGAGEFFSCEQLLDKIIKIDDLTGVTISGGEPFLQFDELFKLVVLIKEKTKLDIMLYSGYEYDELVLKHGNEIFKEIDIFIDGHYIEELNVNDIYRGSSNQKIYCFTPKYNSFLEKINSVKNRSFEFQISNDDDLYLIGLPPKGFSDDLMDKIKERF